MARAAAEQRDRGATGKSLNQLRRGGGEVARDFDYNVEGGMIRRALGYEMKRSIRPKHSIVEKT